jgi:hypothetical protein
VPERQPHIVNLDGARRYRRLAQSEIVVTRPAPTLRPFRQLFSAWDSIIPAGYPYLRSEGRIVGVCASSVGDAPGQGKEVMALSILNLPVTLSRFSTGYQQNCGK